MNGLIPTLALLAIITLLPSGIVGAVAIAGLFVLLVARLFSGREKRRAPQSPAEELARREEQLASETKEWAAWHADFERRFGLNLPKKRLPENVIQMRRRK